MTTPQEIIGPYASRMKLLNEDRYLPTKLIPAPTPLSETTTPLDQAMHTVRNALIAFHEPYATFCAVPNPDDIPASRTQIENFATHGPTLTKFIDSVIDYLGKIRSVICDPIMNAHIMKELPAEAAS